MRPFSLLTQDLKDDLMRERIAAARAVFDKSSKMFLTCAGVCMDSTCSMVEVHALPNWVKAVEGN